VGKFAGEAGLTEGQAFDLQLAVGEAVANAIEHAYPSVLGTVRVRGWLRRDGVHAEIEDFGAWRRRRSPSGRGRGLKIMAALVKSMNIRAGLSGTKVSLLFRRTIPAGANPVPATPQ
jgi:anti-sigma regulatory factor (Ser/Thr protein kinase)